MKNALISNSFRYNYLNYQNWINPYERSRKDLDEWKISSIQGCKKYMFLTHALHYSTAVFEGIRCYNTPTGSAIFRLPEHVDRFFNSAKLYGMKIRYTKKTNHRCNN